MRILSILALLVPAVALAQPVYVTSWPTSDIPLGIAVGSNGLIYMCTQAGAPAMARVFDAGGNQVGQIGGTSPETYGIGFLGNGNIVLSEYSDAKIAVFAPAGNLLTTWDTGGFNAGYLAVDDADNVYVTDDVGDRVRKLDSAGQHVTDWAVTHPAGIAFLNGKVYVAGMFTQTLFVYLPDGTPVGSFPTGLTRAEQLTVDASGNLLVADWGAKQLRCFNPGGTLLWTLGATIPGYSANPCRYTPIGVAPDGTIYAGDFDHRRIVVLKEQPTPATPTSWGEVKGRYRE